MARKFGFVLLGVLILGMIDTILVGAQGPAPDGRRAPNSPLGTPFSYQGQLRNSSGPVSGTCDFRFGLWDSAVGGTQVGITQTVTGVSVSNGLFTTQLDGSNEFGASAFDGNQRFLAIAVSCPVGGSYTPLLPRQELTPSPYALTALKTAYKNVIVVAKSGGHYNTISAALSSIVDNSSTNRYLIWVAPGTFNETITMKQYVDIEGAGELLTKITYTGSASPNTGTVVGRNIAELRFLTVENTGANTNAIAVYNSGASPCLTHITASASGATGYNYGVYNESSSSPTMTDVTASATGTAGTRNHGIFNYSSSSTRMANVTASASGGQNSEAVVNRDSSPTMTNITASASGGYYNAGVANYTASPTMTNVTASASGGTESYGVYNGSSSPTMTNVVALASGATSANRGVFNFSSSPTMANLTISASGGGESTGVRNESSSSTINNSTIKASGGTTNFGIYNQAPSGTYSVMIRNSQITASSNTIYDATGFSTRIGASLLDGGDVFPIGGTMICAGVYDEAYVFYFDKCP